MTADQKMEEMFNSSSEFELFDDGLRTSETPESMCKQMIPKLKKIETKPEEVTLEPLSVRIMKEIQPKIDSRQNMIIIFNENDTVTIQDLASIPTPTESVWTYLKEKFVTENVKTFFKIAIPVLVLRYMFKMHWRLIKIENSIGKFRR